MYPEAAFAALLASLVIYGAVCVRVGRQIETPARFFHVPEQAGGIITLIFGNLALGTGLIYNVNLATQQGLFAFLVPVGVFAGYIWLGHITRELKLRPSSAEKNLLDIIRRSSDADDAKIAFFYKGFQTAQILTYIFLIAFEIYASSRVLSVLVDPEASVQFVFWTGVVLFGVTIAYTAVGGLRGVIRTDWLQGAFIVLMLVILFSLALWPKSGGIPFSELVSKEITWLPIAGKDLTTTTVFVFSTLIIAISTQFYSILNIGIGANYSGEEQRSVYWKSGIGAGLGISLFILIGLLMPASDEEMGAVRTLLQYVGGGTGAWPAIITFLIIIGMVAVLFSTIDTAAITITQVFYDNVLQKNSFSDANDPVEVWRIRIMIVVGGGLALVPMLWMFGEQPRIIPLLLSSVYALTIMAPLMIGAAIAKRRLGRSGILTDIGGVSCVGGTAVLWVLAIWDTFQGNGQYVSWLVCGGAAIAALVAYADARGMLTRKGLVRNKE